MSTWKILLAGIVLFATPSAWAANTPPDFNASRWKTLVERVILLGESESNDTVELRVLRHIAPEDQTKSHSAQYLSTYGVRDSMNSYHVAGLWAVNEDWRKLENGNWEIDQWIREISLSGELTYVGHNVLVEKESRHLISTTPVPTPPVSDPAALEHWNKTLSEWYERTSTN